MFVGGDGDWDKRRMGRGRETEKKSEDLGRWGSRVATFIHEEGRREKM